LAALTKVQVLSASFVNSAAFGDDLSPTPHYGLQALRRIIFLSVRVAFNRIRPDCHWTGLHRAVLKTRCDFAMCKIAPTIRFAQPFPTVRTVG
jgi:hypothetical protein